jgi:AcrR family transcriptional regulator
MTPATATKSKPPQAQEPALRADARRNREAILKAARRGFAERGLDCQMTDIARTARVGVGTVYRHFPNKEDLIDALAADRFDRLAEHASKQLERADEDPWGAFRDLINFGAELQASDRGLSELLATHPNLGHGHAEASGLLELTAKLIAKAQRAGELRKDLVVEDVPTLVCGLGRVMTDQDSLPARNWERFLAIALDGMRAPGREKLPPAARF